MALPQPADFEKIFYPTNTIASPADIVSGLVPLVEKCTTVLFPETLLDYVGKTTNKRPRDIETICKTLSMLLDISEIRTKQLSSTDYRTTFGLALPLALLEEINDGLGDVYSDDEDGNLLIDSSNVRLTAALLSASAIKHGLHHVVQHTALTTVLLGLQDPYLKPDPDKNEVYGVVAIIHLAVVGDRMCGMLEHAFCDGGITQALKSLKDKGVFKSSSSVKLLERAIANAESGFTRNISESEAWDLLFPTSLSPAPASVLLNWISTVAMLTRPPY